MGLTKAFIGAMRGTFADQWKDIITASSFDELQVVAPGVLKSKNHGQKGDLASAGVISSGSKIYVPENTAAFIYSQSGIEEIITQPGGYEYSNGQPSVFNGDSIFRSIFKQTKERVGYGGISPDEKRIAFVNLREIRGIKFGTHGPMPYNDLYYGVDLDITAYGVFSIKVNNPALFIRNFVPVNTDSYSFASQEARSQIVSEFLQSFIVAINALSKEFRLSQLQAHMNDITNTVIKDTKNAGTWEKRFGFIIVGIGIEAIHYTDASREIIRKFADNKMGVTAFEDVSYHASHIAAQQKVAEGIQNHGFGDVGGMVFGMNIAKSFAANIDAENRMNIDQQIETLKKLKELLDAGILTEVEFEQKKKEILKT